MGWIRALWGRVASVFSSPPAVERRIFRYFDGQRWRAADPLRAYRQLLTHPTFSIEKHPEMCDAGDEEALRITLAAMTEIFGLHAWDDATLTGLPEFEILDLFVAFNAYLDGLKKSTSPNPTLPEHLESEPSDQPSQEASTSEPSDSGSISSESNTAVPG